MGRVDPSLFSPSSAQGSGRSNRPDPRAFWIVTFAFVLTVTSFGKYEISRLTPLFFYPVAITTLYGVSARSLFRKALFVLPFALLVGLFNPLFDRQALLVVGGYALSGGWVSFFSITMRSLLAVTSAILLVMTTPFDRLCLGLEKMRVPRVLVTQLQFLHRYMFLLRGEALRMVRAHDLRAQGNKPKIALSTAGSMIGLLLLRALDRATRVHRAMLVRGFDGEVRVLQPLRFSWPRDGGFTLAWILFFALVRFVNLPEWLFGWVVGK
jgi:cobalt/nickel transport system permease protein